jgi:hypothetical protein
MPAIQEIWQSVLDSGIAAFTLATSEAESAVNLAYGWYKARRPRVEKRYV